MRYSVLVVMDLESRRVEVAGIVREAYDEWMIQVLRNLTDAVDGFLLGKRSIILDRDPLFSDDFRAMLKHCGVFPKRLAAESPNLNAHIERFVRSVREDCLHRIIPLGAAHLRELLREYLIHYHTERPHQGLEGAIIEPANDNGTGPVARRQRLGGLLNYYYREAA